MKKAFKRLAPAWLLRGYRGVWRHLHNRRALDSVPAAARELYRRSSLMSYEHVSLPDEDEASRRDVMTAAIEVYGESWNYYSDALRPEIAQGFIETIDSLSGSGRISYLEIGSCQGLSMSFIALLLRRRGMLRSLTSIDPYFEAGYDEGALGPYEHGKHVPIGKATKKGDTSGTDPRQLAFTVSQARLSTSQMARIVLQARFTISRVALTVPEARLSTAWFALTAPKLRLMKRMVSLVRYHVAFNRSSGLSGSCCGQFLASAKPGTLATGRTASAARRRLRPRARSRRMTGC